MRRFLLSASAALAMAFTASPAFAQGGSSTYLQNALLVDNLLRAKSYTQLTNVYLGLYTTCPSAPTASNPGTEVTGGSYARVTVALGTGGAWQPTQGGGGTGASTGTGGATSNQAQLTFPTPTANWGTVNCWGLLDAPTSGNLLIWGTVTVPQAINNGQAAPYVAAGALTITWSALLPELEELLAALGLEECTHPFPKGRVSCRPWLASQDMSGLALVDWVEGGP